MKSKKALFAWLSERLNQSIDLNSLGVSDETFGNRSFVFLHAPAFQQLTASGWKPLSRKHLERGLKLSGFKVDESYWPESQNVKVQVSYFKGCNWDE